MAKNVLYLPPGASRSPQPAPDGGANTPFNRAFFEEILPVAVAAFVEQAKTRGAVVELTTVDGVTHVVRGISGFHDAWIALHVTKAGHPHPIQAFIPYGTVLRVEVHPHSDDHPTRMGFVHKRRRVTVPVGPVAHSELELAQSEERQV